MHYPSPQGIEHEVGRRRARVRSRRGPLPARRRQRGQSMIIFALSVTVLMGLAGLSIDALRVYDLYARAQRAAEAGALAGVIYMPNNYSTAATGIDGNSAITRALQEVQKNGLGQTATANGACDGVQTSQEVMTCTMSKVSSTALEVTVTEPISVFFLSAVGVQSFSISATAGADYLPSYVLGYDPSSTTSNVWGDGGTAQPKYFMPVINGPAEFQEMGDPYVYCQEGPSQGPPADSDYNAGPLYPLSSSGTTNTVAGFNTNHRQYATSQCGTGSGGNSDQQPPDFTGEATKNTAHPGAYNFAITNTTPNATVWIYNPGFDPTTNSSCNGSQTQDVFLQDLSCTNYYQKYGPLTFNNNFDDPRFYYNVSYSLYRVNNQNIRSADTLINGGVGPTQTGYSVPTYRPYDHFSSDASLHGCSGVYDLSEPSSYALSGSLAGGCTSDPYAYTWQQIGTLSSTDCQLLCRLAVETTSYSPDHNPNPPCAAFTCGWGRHVYSVAVCAPGSVPSGNSCTFGGSITPWNNMDVYLNFPGKTSVSVPMAYIPASYAGRTITISVFNSGVSHGKDNNVFFAIVPPDCTTVTYASVSGTAWYRTSTTVGTPPDANCPSQPTWTWVQSAARTGSAQNPGDDIYHGLWVNAQVTLSASYKGGPWYFDQQIAQGAKDFGQMAISFEVNGGSPVHLIL